MKYQLVINSLMVSFVVMMYSQQANAQEQEPLAQKRNELGFTINNMINVDQNDGLGASVMWYNWNSEKRGQRFGLHVNKSNQWSDHYEHFHPNGLDTSFFRSSYLKEHTLSYGRMYAKNLFPRLKLFLAFDVQAGLAVKNLIRTEMTSFSSSNYYYNKTIQRDYGGIIKFIPSVGMQWNCTKRLSFYTELSYLPFSLIVYNFGLDVNVSPNISSRIGLSFRL